MSFKGPILTDQTKPLQPYGFCTELHTPHQRNVDKNVVEMTLVKREEIFSVNSEPLLAICG